ncbi:MAG: hypothetical protein H6509_12925 [Bryobacterales bacterium]|nr:hypothetical protein [Acidobacteriota bacterium]MCB9385512.1 hypothetical protein [Bryobacterales bacterium]
MAKREAPRVIAGIADHAGWAVVVCVAGEEVVDRRRIELIEPGLPNLAYHHDAQHMPLDEAVALIERVRQSAEACARRELAALPAGVAGIAIRKRPKLPATIAERIADYRAQCVADTVMMRDALEKAARARGWTVCEYEPKAVLALDGMSARLAELGKALGAPWGKDQQMATAAALSVGSLRHGDGSLKPGRRV